MKKVFPIFFAFAMASGCMVGPKFHKSEWKSEKNYRYSKDTASTDSITNLKWWEVYQDTVLQALIDTALVNNKDMQMASSRIMEAQSMVKFHRADMYPAFDYSGSASYLNKSNSEANETGTLLRDNFGAYGMMSWELDFWGKYRHTTRVARAQYLASQESKKVLTTSLVAQVALLYFQVRGLDQQLEIARRTLEVRKESTRIITERFTGGEVAELDKFQAQSQEAITAALVPSLERQIAQTENALSVLLGMNPGYVKRGLEITAQTFPLSIPEGLPSQLLSRRPDVLEAEQLWIAQNEQIGIAQAMRYPSISLTGIFGAASTDLTDITESGSLVGYGLASIGGPLFHFGKNRQRVIMERQKTEQARLRYEKAVLTAFEEVENALISTDTYKREYEARMLQASASHGAAKLSHERYDAGYTNFLEVLENDRTELDAQIQASQALQSHLQSTVQLYKALGGGWELR